MTHPAGSKRTKINKRCKKCGTVSLATARERKCKVRRFGAGSYCCWGALTPVVKPARPLLVPLDGRGLGAVLTEEYQAQVVAERGRLFRETARKAAERATEKAETFVERARVAARTARRHEKTAAKWFKRASVAQRRMQASDADVAALMARTAKATQVNTVRHRIRRAAKTVDLAS